MDGCEKGRSTGEVRYLYKLVFNMSTPVVTKTKITIPAGIEVYLTYKDRYLGGVPVTKPGTYIVEVYPPDEHNVYTRYQKHYSTLRIHNGMVYDGWIVWDYDL